MLIAALPALPPPGVPPQSQFGLRTPRSFCFAERIRRSEGPAGTPWPSVRPVDNCFAVEQNSCAGRDGPAPEELRGVFSDPRGPPASWRTHWERVPRPAPVGSACGDEVHEIAFPSVRVGRAGASPTLAHPSRRRGSPVIATIGGRGRRGLSRPPEFRPSWAAWKDFVAALVQSFHGAFSRARLMRLVRCSLVCGSRGNRY